MVSEKRKLRRKKRETRETSETAYKSSPLFRFKNTIMSTIMISMLIFVSIVIFIPAINAVNQVKSAEQELPSKYIQYLYPVDNLKGYINKLYESEKYRDEDIVQILRNFAINSPFDKNLVIQGIFLIKPKNMLSKDNLPIDNIILNKNNEYESKAIDRRNIHIYDRAKELTTGDGSVYYMYKDGVLDKKKYQNFDAQGIKDNIRVIRIQSTYKDSETNQDSEYYIYILLKIANNSDIESSVNAIVDFSKMFFIIALLLSLIFIYMFARSISKPLVDMEKTVSKIADGDLSGRLDFTKYDEINQLVQSYNTMADALQRLYSTLEKQVQDRTQELKSAYAELQSTQAMMVHSEKMKSLGELVAGIMHEINNPINFIYGNMTHLNNYSSDLIQIIDEYEKYDASLKPSEKECVDNLKQEFDYEFLKTDLPDLIKSCKEGADRAKNIIQDLKSFSRMEEVAITDVDIPREIDTVLNILHNKIKNKADVHKEYIDNVPTIEAFGGQLNQVFMNIFDNAVGAIKEHGDIWVRIKKDKQQKNLVIEIEDNGVGMDAETMDKVFNPFFTTKPVGQGTGLGMSITYKIIKNHQGDIKVESTPNVGTKFIVTLPLNIDRDLLKANIETGELNG